MVTDRQRTARKRFQDGGCSLAGASAIVGNLVQESGKNLDSTVERGTRADHGSGGIGEWRLDRKDNLKAFASMRNVDVNGLDVQCDFLLYELKREYPLLLSQLIEGKRTIDNLTANFCFDFERPNRAKANLDGRIEYAKAVLRDALGTKEEPKPQAPVPVPADIPASTAGCHVAILDIIASRRDDLILQRDGVNSELEILETVASQLMNLNTTATPQALPKPTDTRNHTPSNMKGKSMGNPQVLATVRSLLLAAGGALVSNGWMDNSTMTSIVGGVMFVVPYAWSLWGHRKDGIIAEASAVPGVHRIVTTSEIANSAKFAADPKVVDR